MDHIAQSNSNFDTESLSSPISKKSFDFPGNRLNSISETTTQFSSMSIEVKKWYFV